MVEFRGSFDKEVFKGLQSRFLDDVGKILLYGYSDKMVWYGAVDSQTPVDSLVHHVKVNVGGEWVEVASRFNNTSETFKAEPDGSFGWKDDELGGLRITYRQIKPGIFKSNIGTGFSARSDLPLKTQIEVAKKYPVCPVPPVSIFDHIKHALLFRAR